jgi:hypothetical protein
MATKGKATMIRNLKALGLALVALGALSAISAGGASAAGERFHSEVEPTILTGTNTNTQVTAFGGANIECTSVTFRGTATLKTESTLTLHPTYSGCSFLGEPATFDTTGCNYVFSSETVGGRLPGEIECTTGYAIKLTSPGCTLTFGAQKNTGGLAATNEGSGSTRDSKYVLQIGVTFSKSGSLCFLISGTTGTCSGTITVKGFKDEGVTGPIDETEGAAPGKDVTTIYKEGAQVGVWWE